MSRRIKIGSRVSTEAWRFDQSPKEESERWSYKIFGNNWRDARVFGSVIERVGQKLMVEWEIDGDKTLFEIDFLYKEPDKPKDIAEEFISEEVDDIEKSGPSKEIEYNLEFTDSEELTDTDLSGGSSSEYESEEYDISQKTKTVEKHGTKTSDEINSTKDDSKTNDTSVTVDISNGEESATEAEELSGIEQIRLRNIKNSNKVLKDLGFNVSKRKFDRHVPNVQEESEISSDDDEDESQSDSLPTELVSGEEVYLINQSIELFKARYEETGNSEKVHGVPIQEGEGRFFIIKVLRNAIKWDGFDVDVMCPGAAILWNKQNLKRRQPTKVELQGTETKPPTPLETKKRKRKPELWKKNKKKKAVNSGQEFTYVVKKRDGKETKKTIKKRTIKPPCSEKCRKNCREKFPEEIRLQIFSDFYATGDKSTQSQQLSSLVSEQPKKKPRDKNNVNSRRHNTRIYSLSKKGELIQVCQTMFLNTFSIDEKRVRSLLRNKTPTGAPVKDLRGKHKNHRTCEEREKYVMEHITSFKVVESHYVRKDTKYEYLPTELNVASMYRMYKEWRQEKNYPLESYDFYGRVFRERFNLKFQKPKKDRCDTCEQFNNKENATEEEIASQESHLKDKDYVRQLKQSAKDKASTNLTMAAAAFDLQKVLLSPHGQTSSFYYSRRLKNHNFTVTELDNMSTWCYFWSEHECQKGSCEISTSLQKYLIERRQQGVVDFHLFSDRCGGQNNNRMIFVMLSYILNNYDINSIRLTYLVSGHSQSENDNAHSVIEQMASKSTLYTPAEWETLIQCSFKKNKCYLEVLDHTTIVDYKSPDAFPEYSAVYSDKTEEVMTKEQIEKQKALNKSLSLPKRKPTKVFWSEIVDLLFTADEPETMKFKYVYEENFRNATFSLPKRQLREKEQRLRAKDMKRYPEPCGIAPKKKDDLMKLCSKNLIPARHHQFFRSLPTSTKVKDD